MGLNEIKLGVPMPYLVDCILRQLTGLKFAREITDCGDFYEPEKSLQMGMVDKITPLEQVLEKSIEMAKSISLYPQAAFRMNKRNRTKSIETHVLKQLADKEQYFVDCWYSDYARELSYAEGLSGAEIAWQIRLGQLSPPVFDIPLNDRLLDRSQEIIVHSHYVANAVRAQSLARRVRVIPHLIDKRTGHSRRKELSVPSSTLVLGVAGFLTSDKHVDLTLKAIRTLRQKEKDVFLLLVGQVMPGLELERLIADYDIGPAVHSVGFSKSFGAFLDWIATADVVISLRHPTVGETSGSVLRSLSQGRPVIVFDHGWYSELPDDVCWKVQPMDFEHLLHVMEEAAEKRDIGVQKGQNAVKYIADTCNPEKVSELYLESINSYLDRLDKKFLPFSG